MEFPRVAETAREFGGVVETTEKRFPRFFAPEELTDHWPVCSLSKDSCLCSFLIRTKALCD